MPEGRVGPIAHHAGFSGCVYVSPPRFWGVCFWGAENTAYASVWQARRRHVQPRLPVANDSVTGNRDSAQFIREQPPREHPLVIQLVTTTTPEPTPTSHGLPSARWSSHGAGAFFLRTLRTPPCGWVPGTQILAAWQVTYLRLFLRLFFGDRGRCFRAPCPNSRAAPSEVSAAAPQPRWMRVVTFWPRSGGSSARSGPTSLAEAVVQRIIKERNNRKKKNNRKKNAVDVRAALRDLDQVDMLSMYFFGV